MRWLATALLAASVPAGCIGLGDDDDRDRVTKQSASVTDETGGIEGIVADAAVQPVVGVTIRLLETGGAAVTSDDGSYAFSELVPGTYTVLINDTGFVPATQSAVVAAEAVTVVDFVLVHVAVAEAYTQSFEFGGFIECNIGWGWDLAAEASGPLGQLDTTVNGTAGRDPRLRDHAAYRNALAVCYVPNIAFQNSTNDRFIQPFDADPAIHGLAYALTWDDPAGQAKEFWAILEVFPYYNVGPSQLFRKIGPAPVEMLLDRSHFERVHDNFTAACEDGDDDYCGRSFFDEGWPLVLRVFAYWTCLSEKAGICFPVQQSFTHLVDVFYNTPAPAGYSVMTKG